METDPPPSAASRGTRSFAKTRQSIAAPPSRLAVGGEAMAAPRARRKTTYSPGQTSTWGTGDRFLTQPRGWSRNLLRDEEEKSKALAFDPAEFDLLDDPPTDATKPPGTPGAAPVGSRRPSGGHRSARPQESLVKPERCTADGKGLKLGVLRVPCLFFVNLRDAAGHACLLSADDKLRVQIRCIDTPPHSTAELIDGRVAVKWIPGVTGDFTIAVLINGVHIAGSPFSGAAVAGRIDSSQSEVRKVPTKVMAGSHARCEVLLRDQFGNLATYPPLRTNGFRCFAVAKGPTVVEAEVLDTGEGTREVTFRMTKLGEYTVTIEGEDGVQVKGSPFELSVRSQTIEARLSKLKGKGLREAQSGQSASFEIQSVDKFGNPCGTEDYPADESFGFTVLLSYVQNSDRAHASKYPEDFRRKMAYIPDIRGTIKSTGLGKFEAQYTVSRAGDYMMRVTHGKAQLEGSPFKVHVSPGPTFVHNCIRLTSDDEGSASLPASMAGIPSQFDVLARDYFGNSRLCGGDQFVASLSGPETLQCKVTDREDGRYTIRYQPTLAGRYSLSCTLRNEQIKSAPFPLNVLPAAAHAPSCVFYGPGTSSGSVGVSTEFTIEARDKFGNSRGEGGDNFVVVLIGPGASAAEHRAELVDDGYGKYQVHYHIDHVGRYVLRVTLDGENIKGSPTKIVISGARSHPAACGIVGLLPDQRDLPPSIAGEPYSFGIEAHDDFGHLRNKGGDKFMVVVGGIESIRPDVEDHQNGAYTCSFVPRLAGKYLVGVTLNKQHIMGSRFFFEVRPNRVHPASCLCSGSGLSNATAGRVEKFVVTAWDAFGNMTTPDLDFFYVSIAGLDSPITLPASGRDVGEGRYHFSYQANVAGRYEVHVCVKESAGAKPAPVQGSPFVVTVHPDRTSPSACAVRTESKSSLMAGDTIRLSLLARDRFFNPRSCGGDKFDLQLLPDCGRGMLRGRARVHVGEVVDNGNGTYVARVTSTVAGSYRLLLVLMPDEEKGRTEEPTAESQAAPESPAGRLVRLSVTRGDTLMGLGPGSRRFSSLSLGRSSRLLLEKQCREKEEEESAQALEARRKGVRVFFGAYTIYPNVTHAPSCFMSGEGLWQGIVLQRNTFLIQPRDKFGNKTDELCKSFRVSMYRATDASAETDLLHESENRIVSFRSLDKEATASVSVTTGPEGSALASYICTQPGTYWLHVTLQGQEVQGSPFRCKVMQVEELPAIAAHHASVARQFRANALSWDSDTASAWEAHSGTCEDYILHKLTRPGLPVTLGVDMALTWKLASIDPFSYQQKQLEESRGGLSGSRGRYIARKRTAMLHNRLTTMTELLDPGYAARCVEEVEPDDYSAPPSVIAASRRALLNDLPSSRRIGIDTLNHSDASDSRDAPAIRPAILARSNTRSMSTRERIDRPPGLRYRSAAHAPEVARTARTGTCDPPPARWRVLGPTPEPPEEPQPTILTPRAQSLAMSLDKAVPVVERPLPSDVP
ncbi:hypothetical protein AB1Y20_007420 [Prymnesium parvum]|uniref:Uncharacterized protein n=1 Tax=Prymnesium parvum TaxID=97485 RepID=A0AB34IV90_PRYPA